MAELSSRLSEEEFIRYQDSKEYGRYGIRGIPAMVITNYKGDELTRVSGLYGMHMNGTLVDTVVSRAKSFIP